MKLPIETPSLFGALQYPEAKELMQQQQDIMWTEPEIPVSNDLQDYKQNMSPAQFKLASTTLDLFVETEQEVGEVWNVIASWFPHSEIEGAAIMIAAMEKSVHAFFYQKMSDVMNIPPEVTAANQEQITVIRNKLAFLKNITANLGANKALSLATVAGIEQVMLFGSFAMLKTFNSNGNNLIPNTITGVNFVVQDETLHGLFSAYLHNTYIAEHDEFDIASHHSVVVSVIEEIVYHEIQVIKYVFQGVDKINDTTASDLIIFVKSRADEVLQQLGINPVFHIKINPIGEWFYKGIKAIKMHDFFVSGTNQYRRNWKSANLSRIPFTGDANEQV